MDIIYQMTPVHQDATDILVSVAVILLIAASIIRAKLSR